MTQTILTVVRAGFRASIALTTVLTLLMATAAEARVVVRLGTLAPKDSSWDLVLRKMGADWAEATDREVALRIYPGGSVGDEGEMIRKMRIGQLQAAAISNVGLAEIEPSAYALMLPMMFESYDEWDYARKEINPLLEQRLEEKGFVVLAWSDLGWVYFFTQKPMRTPQELMSMKLAGSHTESRTIEIFKWAGFSPVPISAVDMPTGLQTGLIDSLNYPIILMEGSQLYRQAPNMTELKWAPLQGAVVMHEKGWQALDATQRDEVLRITRGVGDALRRTNREQERRSLEAMKSRGLEVVEVSEEDVSAWLEVAERAYPRVRGTLVPEEMFDRVVELRDEFRAREAEKP